MKIRKARNRQVVQRTIFLLAFLAGGALLLFFFYPAVLSAGGEYLSPEGAGEADVVIIEGNEVITEQMVRAGIGLIFSGRARSLVVVYKESGGRPIGLPDAYDLFLRDKISDLGLKKDQIRVYIVPQEHPITLNEARIVLSKLASDNIRSAILLAEDFHTRRSYWSYKHLGEPLGVNIIASPYFSEFKKDGWWQNSEGFRSFFGESVKFLYYVLNGYLPLKSLVTT
jgi:hypothetical protein